MAGLQPSEAGMARVLEGRAHAEAADFAAAETTFRALLDEARDRHDGDHAIAMQSLITLYGRGGRYLEAHLLARRLADAGRAAEDDKVLAFALGAVCGALSQLDLVEPLGHALADLRVVLDRVEEPYTNLELEYHAAAGVHARGSNDFPRARDHMTAYRQMLQDQDVEDVFRWALLMGQAQLAFHEGNPMLARHLVDELGGGEKTPPFHRLKELALAAGVHAALDEPEAAREAAREALGILESVQEQSGLASGRIHEGSVLADTLEAMGEYDLAARVHDLVAAAVLLRLQQVDQCTRELPELGLDDEETTAVLTRFRQQFVRGQRELLRRVAALFDSRGDAFVQSLIEDAAPDGLVAICAWCESVRPADGRWLPIGHFIPREASFQVTHAICPGCAARMEVV